MHTLRLLLLEDNPADVELLTTTLTSSGIDCEISVVETQVAFQSILETQQIDLVLSDYSLPAFDGLTAIKLVQSQFSNIPCILVSGVLGEERAIEALKCGAADYVLKQRLERLGPAVKRAYREQQERLALAQATAALQESEVRFRTSVETMLDCFAMLSSVRDSEDIIQDFTVSYLNAAACDYLSVSRDFHLGKSMYTAIPGLKNTSNTDLFCDFCWVVDTGNPYQKEVILQGYKASLQFVVIDVRVAKHEDGVVVTWRDVTEYRQTEQQRVRLLKEAQRAQIQAERANRVKGAFLSALSHELRSPLGAISGWLQLIEIGVVKPAVLEKALETIRRNTDLLEQIISDALETSRIMQGRFLLNFQPMMLAEVHSIVEEVIEMIEPTAQAKQISLLFTPFSFSPSAEQEIPTLKQMMGDAMRLEQLVWHLLSNAVEFTPAQGRVAIAPKQQTNQPQSITITVTDTGKGISADALPTIFEGFWQSDNVSSPHQQGLKLGLLIAKHIVESHGGRIQAKSAGPGEGSTFEVNLPLTIEQNERLSASPATASEDVANELVELVSSKKRENQSLDDANVSLQDVRVLVVEDQKDALELYVLMLEEYSADVRGVASAADALNIFHQFRPQVLISDISMPDESGYALMRQIRSIPESKGGGIPAIALSAYTEESYRTRALLAGFQLHVAKPVDLKEMARLVLMLAQN
ncbi:MAG: response regulator [Phormidesmis sp.]